MLRENESRFKKASAFVLVMSGMYLISILINYIVSTGYIEMYEGLKNQNNEALALAATMSGMFKNIGLVLLHGLINLTLSILAIVFFLQWFRRAYFNAEILNKEKLRFSNGMAAGGWFIPIVQVWFPLQMSKEIDEANNKTVDQLGLSVPKSNNNLLALAWLGYIIMVYVTIFFSFYNRYANLSSAFNFGSDMADYMDKQIAVLTRTMYIAMASGVINFVGGIFLFMYMRNSQKVQREIFAKKEKIEGQGFEIEGSGISSASIQSNKPDFPVSGNDII